MRKKGEYSLKHAENRRVLREGLKDGIPIGLGYLAVSFSLGIAARNAGLDPAQGFLASLLCIASAGEYAGFTVIAAAGGLFEIALATFVANARYMLMSCALSLRVHPDLPMRHRLGMAFFLTDEIFGISIARPGYMNPCYTYGSALSSVPFWAVGTMLGVIAGNLLPVSVVSAFSVALYGMFLAVIIPPARKNKVVAGLIVLCFAASYAASVIPGICELSEGMRTIILTLVIATGAALLFPRKEEAAEEVAQ